jgi:hypothetical protein
MNNEYERILERSCLGLICSIISGFRLSEGSQDDLKTHLKGVGLKSKSQKQEAGMPDVAERV